MPLGREERDERSRPRSARPQAARPRSVGLTRDTLEGRQAIIFDCDGTLVDSAPIYARAWAAGFATAGGQMTCDWYLQRKRRMSVEPAQCIVLEDSDTGIDAALAAGMGFVDVRDDVACVRLASRVASLHE